MDNYEMRQIVSDARALIANRENWCQNHEALDEHGKEVLPTRASACEWCASGAVARVLMGIQEFERYSDFWSHISSGKFFSILDKLQSEAPDRASIETFNDTHSHDEVLAVFDKVLEKLA